MNREEIMKILPHRDSMLLLDEAEENDGEAVGRITIKGDEWFLKGHFPDEPVVPGVILCEIMAQSACVLLKDSITEDKLPMYTGIKNVKFRTSVRPGDTFTTHIRISRSMGSFYFVKGTGYVGDRLAIEGDFSFAIADRSVLSDKA